MFLFSEWFKIQAENIIKWDSLIKKASGGVANRNGLRDGLLCLLTHKWRCSERTQWLSRIWISGSVWLVTGRCSSDNPVVSLANGIRTLCVNETEPWDNGEALRLRLYRAFSLNLASSVWHCQNNELLLIFTQSQIWIVIMATGIDRLSQSAGSVCPDIWIFFLNDKKKAPVGFFFHRVENQLKRSNQLAPKHSQCFEVEETAFKWRIMDSLISGTEGTHSPCFLGFPLSPFYVISYSSNLANIRPEPAPLLRTVKNKMAFAKPFSVSSCLHRVWLECADHFLLPVSHLAGRKNSSRHKETTALSKCVSVAGF